MPEKWYSHGLTAADIRSFQKLYANVRRSGYWGGYDQTVLQLYLGIEDGRTIDTYITDQDNQEDIKELLKRAKVEMPSQLVGKVIESYWKDGYLECISVNENLV